MRARNFPLFVGLVMAAAVLFSSTSLVARADAPAQGGGVGVQALLYDQYNNFSSDNDDAPSQQYEAAQDPFFNTEAADDFELPASANPYIVTSVEVPGRYSGNPSNAFMTAVRVRFYANSGSLPGTQLYDISVPPTSDSAGDLVVTSGSPLLNGSTRYWISVEAVLNFGAQQRQWWWKARTATAFNPSAWKTKSDNYPTCLNVWGVRTAAPPGGCGQGNPAAADLAFRLNGFAVTSRIFLPLISR